MSFEIALSRYTVVVEDLKSLRLRTRSLNKERKEIETILEGKMKECGAQKIATADGSIVVCAKERIAKRCASKAEIAEAVAEQSGLEIEQVEAAIDAMATKTKRVKLTLTSKPSAANTLKCSWTPSTMFGEYIKDEEM